MEDNVLPLALNEDWLHDESDFTEEDDEEEEELPSDFQPESIDWLLQFHQRATLELQSYFNRNKEREDFCKVYDDKFQECHKSYYADILEVADMATEESGSIKCEWPCSGRMNARLGLGPLEELFQDQNYAWESQDKQVVDLPTVLDGDIEHFLGNQSFDKWYSYNEHFLM